MPLRPYKQWDERWDARTLRARELIDDGALHDLSGRILLRALAAYDTVVISSDDIEAGVWEWCSYLHLDARLAEGFFWDIHDVWQVLWMDYGDTELQKLVSEGYWLFHGNNWRLNES